jgi:hypothetical protein
MDIKVIRCLWGKQDHQFFEKNLQSYHDECYLTKENDDLNGIDNQMVIVWDEPNRKLMEELGYQYYYMGESNEYSLNLNFLHKIIALEKAMEMYDEILFLDWDCLAIKPIDKNFQDLLRSRGDIQIPLYFYPGEIIDQFRKIDPIVDDDMHYFNMFFYNMIRNCNWKFMDGLVIPNAGFIYCKDKDFFKNLLRIQKINGIISNIEEICSLIYFKDLIKSTKEYIDKIEPLVCLGKDDLEMKEKQIFLNKHTTEILNKDIYFIHE